jgi:phosphate transport system protein
MNHYSRSFDQELSFLKDTIENLSLVVFNQVDRAAKTLKGTKVKKQLPAHLEINSLHQKVENQVLNILALRSPVADDLRLVVATLKLASSLKQVAEHASAIIQKVQNLSELPNNYSAGGLYRLILEVLDMLKKVVIAYQQENSEKAMEVWYHDEQVDERHASLFRELLTYMMEDSKNIAVCSELVFVAKDIERMGDHATNIAEMVYYYVTGNAVEGQRPKGNKGSDWSQSSQTLA